VRLTRRSLLTVAGLGAGAGLLGVSPIRPRRDGAPRAVPEPGEARWLAVRDLFEIDPDRIHLAGMLLAPHARPVREAIERHRRAFDRDPAGYVEAEHGDQEARVRRAAADYLGAAPDEVALTFNTTTGLGLVYGGVAVRAGQQLLTTEHDYHATHRALRYQAARTGAEVEVIRLYDRPEAATADEMVDRLRAALTPRTRVVALTWVHSSSGVKIPVRAIADVLAEHNAGRDAADRALFCVDGVHGLGVEADDVAALGCDVLIAGTHKWLMGPRGTGLIWARRAVHGALGPLIESFTRDDGWGGLMTPGGFHAFEHRWALPEALALHAELGKPAIAARIHELAARYQAELARLRHVTLRTPRDPRLSAGIVCFEVDGRTPGQVVRALGARGIVAGPTPYRPSYARLAPGLLNHLGEIEPVIAAIRALG
jgi:isopenicillin-N epimerase